ncbi:hypothetical protein NXG27_04005 [Megasphaera paucivorans]|uniref:Major tropism determinant N-terminal domain-containing protein n=1 Tax=Megasphaera paucivorans TaxID=349095 RepID=A0A1G9QWJ9_9FIRM|nr:hypothetical protein [Megasphaera paucivorans]SDM15396.1 hypothetical protein SAMN05660299_00311 [Megasphaera paucivorans]
MATQTLNNVQILLRNDTAANWNSKNPVLGKGELGLEIDTGRFKFGDGATAWNDNTQYGGIMIKANAKNGYITIDGVDTLVYTLNPATSSALGGIKSGSGIGAVAVDSNGNASVASVAAAGKLSTGRTISLGGDISGSTTFDGSVNAAITVALVATGVTAGTYPKVTVDAKGRITSGSSLMAGDIPSLPLSKISDAGTAAAKNIGTAAGNVPVLDSNGKLADSMIPSLAIGDVFPAASDAEMIKLSSAQQGDICVRSDTNTTYMLKVAPYSTLANWVQLKTPTDLVQSVNGKTGVVIITTNDIAEGSNHLYWTQARFTAAFQAMASTELSDGATILHNTDTLIINCGNA